MTLQNSYTPSSCQNFWYNWCKSASTSKFISALHAINMSIVWLFDSILLTELLDPLWVEIYNSITKFNSSVKYIATKWDKVLKIVMPTPTVQQLLGLDLLLIIRLLDVAYKVQGSKRHPYFYINNICMERAAKERRV